MQQIATPRLILERPATRIASRLLAWQTDAELLFLSDDSEEMACAEDISEVLARWNRLDREDLLVFSIVTRGGEDPIGYVQVANIDRHNRSCDIGMLIGEKAYWGKGLGKEALQAIVRLCFEELGLNRIGGEIYSINPRSIRLFEACGFVREGVARERVLKTIDGEPRFVDAHYYGLLHREWLGLNPVLA